MNRVDALMDDISSGEMDDHMDEIVDLIKVRIKAIRQRKLTEMIGVVRVGDYYVLRRIKPQYLGGQIIKVIEVVGTKARIEMLYGIAGRNVRAGMTMRVPITCLEPYEGEDDDENEEEEVG
jgi:hypothetical protein